MTGMRFLTLLVFLTMVVPSVRAQWVIQESNTTADLRGIHNVGGGVAWASGTGGTVLRTTDDGAHWQKCAIPDAKTDGATLDFRSIQAWDDRNAYVMSSGPGEKSRLYRTTNGCKSWKLILKNRDKDGSWVAVHFELRIFGWLLGDPVNGMFTLFTSENGGRYWIRQRNKGLRVQPGTQRVFAASNSSLIRPVMPLAVVAFGSGGSGGSFVYFGSKTEICVDDCPPEEMDLEGRKDKWDREAVPLGHNTNASGVFSISGRHEDACAPYRSREEVLVAVGGDYDNPNDSSNTAAFKLAYDQPWTASANPPHGYRSSVQWSSPLKTWIAVGLNGTDVSRDDGHNWRALKPSAGEPADADRNWNALSLPFVVGPAGRIGRLREDVLKH
ncbi:MAG: hypothetical protein ABSG25_09940 [Bryobacteraceae bacterium]